MRTFEDLATFAAAAGQELGTSAWLLVDQARIQRFADATGDHQWIHVDPVRAADGPYGTTIAHGYLTLSILPQLTRDIFEVRGLSATINYGLERVRFPAPVPAGSRVRARSRLVRVSPVDRGVQAVLATTVDIDGMAKPACVAESVVRYLT